MILHRLIAGLSESAGKVRVAQDLDRDRMGMMAVGKNGRTGIARRQHLQKAGVVVRAHRLLIQREDSRVVGDTLRVLKIVEIVGHRQSERTDLMKAEGNLRTRIAEIQEVARDLGIGLANGVQYPPCRVTA